MGEVFQLLLSPEPQQGILTRTLTTSTLLSLPFTDFIQC